MPTIYIYALSDFTTSIPNERGAQAQGNPPFTISTGSNITRIAVEVTDNDAVFDEIDSTQTLTNDLTLDGVTYSADDRIFANYILSGDSSGIELFSVSIGVNNSGRNITNAVATLEPLDPNTTYTFTAESNYNNNDKDYVEFICFARGTPILTPRGEVSVEELSVGDLVTTVDNGPQEIRWIGHREVPARGRFAPIRIAAGVLGTDCDLIVSPQHRMLICDWRSRLLFDAPEVLVPAVQLCDERTIRRDPRRSVDYFHLLFEQHEVVFSAGCPSESFHPGDYGLDCVGKETRKEIFDLFPELAISTREYGPTARPSLKGFEAALLRDIN